jgi:hypothetical protein
MSKNIYSTPRDLLKFDMGRNSPEFFQQNRLIGYSNEHKGKNNYGLGSRMINLPTTELLFSQRLVAWYHTSAYITLPEEK